MFETPDGLADWLSDENSDATALDLPQGRTPLPQAVAGGRRAVLEALAAYLAEALEACPPDRSAPLAAQLRAAMADLDSLPLADGLGVIYDLDRERDARHAAVGSPAAEAAAPAADVLLNGR